FRLGKLAARECPRESRDGPDLVRRHPESGEPALARSGDPLRRRKRDPRLFPQPQSPPERGREVSANPERQAERHLLGEDRRHEGFPERWVAGHPKPAEALDERREQRIQTGGAGEEADVGPRAEPP